MKHTGKLVYELAPYFSTIDPQFVDMKPGYVEKTALQEGSRIL